MKQINLPPMTDVKKIEVEGIDVIYEGIDEDESMYARNIVIHRTSGNIVLSLVSEGLNRLKVVSKQYKDEV